ncbi:MAG: hypothetical protein M3O30_02250 [Planctomycetota bacterium]|nr:hypothetical protein [Planctomycetota bacterium]
MHVLSKSARWGVKPFLISLVAVFSGVFTTGASAGNFSTLYSFQASTGKDPYGTLIQSGSNLYATTAYGGASNAGTIYDYDTSSNSMNFLYTFAGGAMVKRQRMGG